MAQRGYTGLPLTEQPKFSKHQHFGLPLVALAAVLAAQVDGAP